MVNGRVIIVARILPVKESKYNLKLKMLHTSCPTVPEQHYPGTIAGNLFKMAAK